jgi:hypothetical protein
MRWASLRVYEIWFAEDGSLGYEPSPLKHFSWRYVVVSDATDGEEMAAAIAEASAS